MRSSSILLLLLFSPKIILIITTNQGIFFLANDPSPDVRKRVCHAFVMLVEIRVDYLIPFIRNVVQFMLHSMQDPDEGVALEACEFWSAIADTNLCIEVLTEFLPV